MLADAVRRFLAAHGLAPKRIVAAVSGGFDSTAMLLALAELRDDFELVAGHVNHHLRGEESEGDEAFVRDLCATLDIPLHVADGALDSTVVRERGIEAAAREVRFARLQDIRSATAADFIATAHQKNDQAETVLMRLMSAGSPAALRGIHPVRADGVIRPLLGVTRREITTWLEERGIHPRIDRSNHDPRFLRNRVRMLLQNVPGSAVENLAATAAHAAEQWPVLLRSIDAAEDVEALEGETRFRSLPDDLWLRQALLHRHIVRLDPGRARNVSAHDLERLAHGAGPRVSVTKSLELLRRNGTVILRRIPTPPAPFEVALMPGHPAHIDSLGLTVRIEPETGTLGDAQRIQLLHGAPAQFTVRNRRNGDRFHPLGYPVPTKLKDFLIARKIPREERDRIPLVVWNGQIVWVAGVAVSENFKTRGGDGDVYTLTLDLVARFAQ
jgi:tRNA(Ile)-lysidine synthase